MKKLLEILGTSKTWITLGIKWLGQLLGVVKKVEQELEEQAEEEKKAEK